MKSATSKFLTTAAGGLVAAAFALTAAHAGDDASKVLSKYEKTGERTSCLPLTRLKDSDPLDDRTILFELSTGQIYLNELRGTCIGLGRHKRFSYQTTQNKICSGDIITVSDNVGNAVGSCGLGQFEALSMIAEAQ